MVYCTLHSSSQTGNIGNANIEGLSEDLHLVGNQYNWYESPVEPVESLDMGRDLTISGRALTVFFFPYCFLEPICNLLLVRFKPSVWLPSIMVAWGKLQEQNMKIS